MRENTFEQNRSDGSEQSKVESRCPLSDFVMDNSIVSYDLSSKNQIESSAPRNLPQIKFDSLDKTNENTYYCSEQKESSIDAAQFEKTFGGDVANALNSIGCTEVKVKGDYVTLKLAKGQEIPKDIGAWNKIKLDEEISFKCVRDGDNIKITEGKGVRLKSNDWLVKGKEFPSLVISPSGVSLKNYPIEVSNDKNAHRDLDKILKAVGK